MIESIREMRTALRNVQMTIIVTAIGATLTTLLGLAAFNATLLSTTVLPPVPINPALRQRAAALFRLRFFPENGNTFSTEPRIALRHAGVAFSDPAVDGIAGRAAVDEHDVRVAAVIFDGVLFHGTSG
jgi:hypothetical protein